MEPEFIYNESQLILVCGNYMRRILLSEQEIQIAAEQYGTPLYLYNLDKIGRQYTKLQQHLPSNFRIFYALKANSSLSICQKLAQLAAGADISSVGEFTAALKAGFRADQLVFTGPGKTNAELAASLEAGIGLIALESVNEAQRLNDLAERYSKKQNVLVRINPSYRTDQSCEVQQQRSNFGSSKGQGGESSTLVQTVASSASKFGIDEASATEGIATIDSLPNLSLKGIHIFTESNVLNYTQLLASWSNTINIANRLNDQGYPISLLDFGGGIGIPFNPVDDEFDIESFGQELQQLFGNNRYPYQCIVEIGRYLVGESGCYITEVVDIKQSQGKKFIILDGGVHQLLRLSMKSANKYMEVLGRNGNNTQKATLAGKLPAPLDILVEDVSVPEEIAIGDRLVIYNCGSYGFNYSLTNFALHNYPAEVAYEDGIMGIIRTKGNVEDFFINQNLGFVTKTGASATAVF
ncbi:MAG: hypothetical protein F6K37_06770 [Moorea sp. SIO4E2]|uniref:alanine racemase n=1 Tax=Moorena sp. SIO4E2 TaxID=2607826 RepID=UPI0013B7C225|nr:alanine racemase [Moorena sp. SIO4E2]NEQ05673.1 hypothetical protein [Moorena sp. SIO4E2]